MMLVQAKLHGSMPLKWYESMHDSDANIFAIVKQGIQQATNK